MWVFFLMFFFYRFWVRFLFVFSGFYCNVDVDECKTQPGICKNGATCMNTPVGSYTCICVNGWTGKNCTTNIDDCADHPCYNGGTCHDKVGYYFCECPIGKTGKLKIGIWYYLMCYYCRVCLFSNFPKFLTLKKWYMDPKKFINS